MPPRETVGPWRPRREALERLGAPVAQALTEDLREARLELARAAACLAFALAWVGVHLVRGIHFAVGVVVEVVLVVVACCGGSALLVVEGRRLNARAYGTARRSARELNG
ncbi:MAG: hypothetical protein R3B99_35885 [Polyangiales bacterium]|nr:hypothetical protein [Myxococcales bacterium]MCB9601269.1 hypothetical protein [Sandaracinus sp.]